MSRWRKKLISKMQNRRPCAFILIFISLVAMGPATTSFVWAQDTAPTAPGTTEGLTLPPKPLGRVRNPGEKDTESSSFIPDPDSIDPLNPNNENIKTDAEPVLEDIKTVLEAPPPPPEPVPEAVAEVKPALGPDEPDTALEKKFHNIYNRYNKNPTPEDIWQQATSKQTVREYKVQKGDTLWSISQILFGDPSFWPKLWSINKQGILNPHIIRPNTTIYFYSGNDQNSPTMSVGRQAVIGAEPQLSASAVYSGGTSGEIPDSLPVYRNENYYKYQKRDIRMDFKELPPPPLVFSNDIILTDVPLKSVADISIDEVKKDRCYEGRILKAIKSGPLSGDFEVYEPLSTFKSGNLLYYAYQLYGYGQAYNESFLKMNNCRSVLSTNLIVLARDQVDMARSSRTTASEVAKLVGGPEVYSQSLFTVNHKAYVDFGSYEYEPGQDFKVMSNETDRIIGQVKVVEKFGSMGVVLITEVTDQMTIGDSLILN